MRGVLGAGAGDTRRPSEWSIRAARVRSGPDPSSFRILMQSHALRVKLGD